VLFSLGISRISNLPHYLPHGTTAWHERLAHSKT
jgi:hypothetical protein